MNEFELIQKITNFSKRRGLSIFQKTSFWLSWLGGLFSIMVILWYNEFAILFGPFLLLIGIIILLLIAFCESYLSNTLEYLITSNKSFLEEKNRTESISEILTLTSTILTLVNKLRYLRYFVYLFYNSSLTSFNKINTSQVQLVLSTLISLRSDLQLRLTEQLSTLEQAKSEVSTHIQWTNVLNQVSELQKARLDRQIEQFEELQRVIMKV